MGLFDSIFNSAKNSINNSINSAVKSGINKAERSAEQAASKAISNAIANKTKTFKFDSIPMSLSELKACKEADMKDPFGVVALTLLAINAYTVNKDAAIEMLNFLKGPADLSERDLQFIKDRFMDGKTYLPKSYFKGATPANNYEPSTPYTIDVEEQAHSKDQFNEGYMKLFVRSGGADEARYVVLRTKPSTGEWFLWDYAGILSGIRIPVAQDAWA